MGLGEFVHETRGVWSTIPVGDYVKLPRFAIIWRDPAAASFAFVWQTRGGASRIRVHADFPVPGVVFEEGPVSYRERGCTLGCALNVALKLWIYVRNLATIGVQ